MPYWVGPCQTPSEQLFLVSVLVSAKNSHEYSSLQAETLAVSCMSYIAPQTLTISLVDTLSSSCRHNQLWKDLLRL